MKNVFSILAICLSLHVLATESKTQLSSLIPICSAKDPKLNECVKESAQKLIPFLASGIKDYGLVPLDPLRVPNMYIGQDSGPVTLKLEYVNSKHEGLGRIIVDRATVDLKRGRIVLNTTHPYYSLTGRYIADGRILIIPVVGDGKVNITQVNNKADVVIEGKPHSRNGETYFNVEKFRVYFKFGKSYFSLTNLFNGNKELGETTNRFLNSNANEVFEGLKNTLQDVYSDLYGGLVKKIFENVPYNQLFKDV